MDANEFGVEIAREDAIALIGVLANIAAGLQVGYVDKHLANRMHRRLVSDLQAVEGRTIEDLLQALNMRLRQALGETP